MFNIFRRSDDKLSRYRKHESRCWSLIPLPGGWRHHYWPLLLLIDIMQCDIKPTIPPPTPTPPTQALTHRRTHTHIKVTTKLYAKTKHQSTDTAFICSQPQSWKVFDNFFFSSKTVGQHGGIFSLGLFFITCVLEDLYTSFCTLSVDHWLFQGKKCTF